MMKKRIFLLLLCIAIFMTTLVTASAQRRGRSRFGRKARTAAIIAGGAGAGALIGGKKGAAIGAGASTMYAMNRKAARRNFKRSTRTVGTVAGGTALGAGIGSAIGRKKGGIIGAIAGAGGSYIYSRRNSRRRY
jgi:hypothetical protein